MKVYSVKPGSLFIRVSDGRQLLGDDGDIAWGDSGTGAFYLSRAILADVLGDRERATRLAQRFKWRTVKEWPKDSPRAITEDEVRSVVAQIEAVEKENAPMIARQQREKPQFLTDSAGPGQAWDNNPDIKPKEKVHGPDERKSTEGKRGTN